MAGDRPLFSGMFLELDDDAKDAIARALGDIAKKEANESRGHFGQGTVEKLEICAGHDLESPDDKPRVRIHFVFDVHDWVRPMSGSEYWKHLIYIASADLVVGATVAVIAKDLDQWSSSTVEESDETTYDWAAGVARAKKICEDAFAKTRG